MLANDPGFLEDLVGYQLGLCDEQGRWEIESTLGTSRDARQRAESLQRVLRPLSAYHVSPPSALVPGILDRIRESNSIFKLNPRKSATVEPTAQGDGRSLLSLRELLSLAAAIILFVGVFVPGYQAARNNAARGLCMEQMRMLGTAMGSYVEANSGMLPYNSANAVTGWLADRAALLPKASNHLQPLKQGQYLPGPRILSCPGVSTAGENSNYNVQLFLIPPSIQQLPQKSPIISDPNPMVVNGRYLPVDALRNSDAHGPNAGQTILRLDGSAGWHDKPTVGVDGDDIFRVNDPSAYSREPARAIRDDPFLIP